MEAGSTRRNDEAREAGLFFFSPLLTRNDANNSFASFFPSDVQKSKKFFSKRRPLQRSGFSSLLLLPFFLLHANTRTCLRGVLGVVGLGRIKKYCIIYIQVYPFFIFIFQKLLANYHMLLLISLPYYVRLPQDFISPPIIFKLYSCLFNELLLFIQVTMICFPSQKIVFVFISV